MYEKKVLLDTCALLWLASGDAKLSSAARESINAASIVLVSSISAWEISLKALRGQLLLPLEPEEWFDRAVKKHHLTIATLSIDVACASNRLPWHHNDPADRFIIATAQKEHAAVITADSRFSQYGIPVLC